MSKSSWSGGVVAFILALFALMLFATGYLHLNRDVTKCQYAKLWTFDEGYRTWFAIGLLEFRYRPVNYDCAPDAKYDPRKFRLQNGERVPLDNSTNTIDTSGDGTNP